VLCGFGAAVEDDVIQASRLGERAVGRKSRFAGVCVCACVCV